MNGIITLNVATGVTTTYDTPLGAAEKLIKTGGGTAVLSKATTDFKGSVDIQEGELKLTDANAAGIGNKIEVTGDAATLHLNIPRPEGHVQNVKFFTGHNVTIRGKGVDGKGAFRYTAISDGTDDSMLESLTLSGDANIAVPSRFGIYDKLNLNGHTLTRVDGTANWMFYMRMTIDHGTISNKVGQITIQHTPVFTDPENTIFAMVGGWLTTWNMKPALPCNVVFGGGGLDAGAGEGVDSNIFAGKVTLDANLTPSVKDNKVMQFTGNLVGNGKNFSANQNGTQYFNCSTEGVLNMCLYDSASIAFTSNVVRKINDFRSCGSSNLSCYRLDAGRLETGIIRMANGGLDRKGTLLQTGGELDVTWDIYFGEGTNSYGAIVMTEGTNVFKNTINFAGGTQNAFGAFWQYGGKNTCTSNIRLSRAGRGFLGVWNGGVFDCYVGKYENNDRICLGDENYGTAVLSIDGPGSVMETGNIKLGNSNVVSTNYVVVSNGGTLKARRFYRVENTSENFYSEVYVNGGTIMPTWWYGWCHASSDKELFGRRSPNHWVIGPKGMVVDTRDIRGDNATQELNKECHWPHVLEDPQGQGIASIELPTDDEFMKEIYNAPAFIDIEGPEGSYGAVAMAEIEPNAKKLKRVAIVAEGSNYDESTRIFVHSATNYEYRFECTYTLTGERTPGPLIKRGDGTLGFVFDNRYSGGTIVEEGKITLFGGKGFPENTPLDVREGAILDSTGHRLRVSYLGSGGGTILSSGLNVTKGIRISPKVFFEENSSLQVSSVNFAEGCELVIDDIAALHDYRTTKPKVLLTATGGITGTVPEASVVDDYGTRWVLYQTDNNIKFGPVRCLRVIVK